MQSLVRTLEIKQSRNVQIGNTEHELFAEVGRRIRELRRSFNGGTGLSQEVLAEQLATTANTISRWETATYQPSLRDLDALSRFFGVSILTFFPDQRPSNDDKVNALLRTAKDLPDSDLEELRRFAEFRKAQGIYRHGRPVPGRKAVVKKRST